MSEPPSPTTDTRRGGAPRSGPERQAANDRLAYRIMFVGIAAALWMAFLYLFGDSLASDTETFLGLTTFIAWLYLGTSSHLLLLAYALWRAWQGAARAFAPMFIYLAVIAACYLQVARDFGLAETLASAGLERQRAREQPAQLALEAAITRNDVDAARRALAEGADPNRPKPGAWMPPLSWVASQQGPALLGALLEAGADPNATTSLTWSTSYLERRDAVPLDHAANRSDDQRLPLVRRLLAAGARPQRSALLPIACHEGDLELYELAIAGDAPDDLDSKGRTCLHQAADRGHTEIIHRHLPQALDPGALTVFGQTALDVALMREHDGIALLLVTAGVSANQQARVTRTLSRTDGGAELEALQTALHKALQAAPRAGRQP